MPIFTISIIVVNILVFTIIYPPEIFVKIIIKHKMPAAIHVEESQSAREQKYRTGEYLRYNLVRILSL